MGENLYVQLFIFPESDSTKPTERTALPKRLLRHREGSVWLIRRNSLLSRSGPWRDSTA